LIDVSQGKLIWRLGDEDKEFKVFGSSNNSSSPTCNFVQATNKMKTNVAKPRQVQGRKTL